MQETAEKARELLAQLKEPEEKAVQVSRKYVERYFDSADLEDKIRIKELDLSLVVVQLENCIDALDELSQSPSGSVPVCPGDVEIPRLPVFLPLQVRSDWAHSLVNYDVHNGESHASDKGYTRFAGNASCYQVTLEPGREVGGFPDPGQKIQMEFHAPDSDELSFEGNIRLVTAGQDEKAIDNLLGWLEQNGLDCRRPGVKEMQMDYEQHLQDRPDSARFPPFEVLPRWEKHTRRINGRIIQLLPEERRLPKPKRNCLHPVHNPGFFPDLSADPLRSIAERNLTLLPFTGRVDTGCRVNGIGNSGNIKTNAANLVFASLYESRAKSADLLIKVKPHQLDRVDHRPIGDGMENQPWKVRHDILPFEEWIQDECSQCNFSGPVSLPESMECIVAAIESDRQKGIKTLQKDFDYWPDGRPVAELFKTTKSLKEQYEEIITPSEDGRYSDKLQKLVEAIGFDQFQQFLSVNPEFHSGNARSISLEGISFDRYVILTGLRLSSLRNTSFCRICFKDCKIVGADMSGCDLTNVRWEFSSPGERAADIDYLSEHIEARFVESKDLITLNRLCSMLSSFGCKKELLELYDILTDERPTQKCGSFSGWPG